MELTTTRDIIGKLGGISAVARLTGRKYTAAANWNRKTNVSFPSDTFVALTSALRAEGCTAPAALWDMVEPPEEVT